MQLVLARHLPLCLEVRHPFIRHMTASPFISIPDADLQLLYARMESLMDEWERRMEQRLRDHDAEMRERESRMAARERSMADQEQRLHEMMTAWRPQVETDQPMIRFVCQYCRAAPCSRDGPCSRHRHHNCSSCHQAWRQGRAKGSGH